MMRHIERLFIICLLLTGCSSKNANCLNYCMDALYTSNLSGVVINKDTRIPIIGANVTIEEGTNQSCPPCFEYQPQTFITDEHGRFDIPNNLPEDYRIKVTVNIQGCSIYEREYFAFELEGPIGMPGEGFELSCNSP